MDIKNKVVIVTGASAGIGKAVSEALSEGGANVVLVARREDRLHMLVEQMAAQPGNRLVIAGDIRSEEFAPQVVERTLAEFGRLDVLVNNAGLGHRSLLVDIPPEDMRTIIETNLLGLLFMTQAALIPMHEQRDQVRLSMFRLSPANVHCPTARCIPPAKRPLTLLAVRCALKASLTISK